MMTNIVKHTENYIRSVVIVVVVKTKQNNGNYNILLINLFYF